MPSAASRVTSASTRVPAVAADHRAAEPRRGVRVGGGDQLAGSDTRPATAASAEPPTRSKMPSTPSGSASRSRSDSPSPYGISTAPSDSTSCRLAGLPVPKTRDAALPGELGGGDSDPAADAGDQQPLPGAQVQLGQAVVGGGGRHRQRRGVDEAELRAAWPPPNPARAGCTPRTRRSRAPASPAPRPRPRIPRPRADLGDHAGDLAAELRGQLAGCEAGEPAAAHLVVDRVHPGGPHLDQQLTGRRPGPGDLGELLGVRDRRTRGSGRPWARKAPFDDGWGFRR